MHRSLQCSEHFFWWVEKSVKGVWQLSNEAYFVQPMVTRWVGLGNEGESAEVQWSQGSCLPHFGEVLPNAFPLQVVHQQKRLSGASVLHAVCIKRVAGLISRNLYLWTNLQRWTKKHRLGDIHINWKMW